MSGEAPAEEHNLGEEQHVALRVMDTANPAPAQSQVPMETLDKKGGREGKEAKATEDEHHHAVKATDLISDDLEKLLQTVPNEGLTAAQVQERLEQFGYNRIEPVKKSKLLKFLHYFTDPIAILIEVAMLFSGIVEDWPDFGIILGLLVVNALIGFIEESKAESAIEALQKTLSLKSKVVRDGKIVEVDSIELVPGDVISVRIGDIVPADCRLLGLTANFTVCKEALMLDEAALTGESLPVSKHRDDIIFSSSICKQGQMMAVVVKTGINTFIGTAANLIAVTQDQSHFQIIVGQIGYFLIFITVALVIIIFIVYMSTGTRPRHSDDSKPLILVVLQQVVVLTVAAIPVGLPTVLSVTMAVGARQLSEKNVIVKRLTAIEELSAVQILCSDKTGTLTLNQLTLDEPYLNVTAEDTSKKYTNDQLLLYGYLSCEHIPTEPIEVCLHNESKLKCIYLKDKSIDAYEVLEFIPFNPDTKKTEALVLHKPSGQRFHVAKGAPQVITKLVGGHQDADKAVRDLAMRGLRALGVAIQHNTEKWHLVGMLSLLDPPRPDSAGTIRQCRELGVEVKMVTGDQVLIAKEVAKRLGMMANILDATALNAKDIPEQDLIRRCEMADGFGQVVPENKFRVVELLQRKRGRLIGMTGDGVNDAPALKKANVGIAVHGCTDAARSAADIVLLAPGLSTIVDGIRVSRAIFQRMRSYALYRISSTVHFLVFFFITILAFNWSLQPSQIILIALLNDAATLVISVDNAQISKNPDKWRLGQLMTLSVILGSLLTLTSFGLLLLTVYELNIGYDDDRLNTIMYLQISSCPHFMIFGTRLFGHFWENRPSLTFIAAILGTQIFAMIISITGLPQFLASINVGAGFAIIAYSTVCFMLLDFVKVYVIRTWSFELTVKLWPVKSRVDELQRRREAYAANSRYRTNLKKMRHFVNMMSTVRFWRRYAALKKAPSLLGNHPKNPNSVSQTIK